MYSKLVKSTFLRCMCLLLVSFLCACKAPYSRTEQSPSQVLRLNKPDSTMFVYSSDQLMQTSSLKFTDNALKDLYEVVRFARLYPSLRIHIDVYEDDSALSNLTSNLAQHRSDVIASYLWSEGVAANRMTTKGHVLGVHPVSSNRLPYGSLDNRRVVVVFTDDKAK